MLEKFDKNKVQIGSNLHESWFIYYCYDLFTDNIKEAEEIYLLLTSNKNTYTPETKLLKYLFLEDDILLLNDYLLSRRAPDFTKEYFMKLREFLQNHNYTLAIETIDRLRSTIDEEAFDSIVGTFIENPDPNTYIFQELNIKEQPSYKEHEISLLFNIIDEAYEDFRMDLELLFNEYHRFDTIQYKLLKLFNEKLRDLEDENVCEERNPEIVKGNIYEVIMKLLSSNDFYRTGEMIEQLPHNNMMYTLLKAQYNNALRFIEKNELDEKKEMLMCADEAYDVNETYPYDVNGEYEGVFLSDLESLVTAQKAEKNISYMQLYEEAYQAGNYIEALKDLQLLQMRLVETDSPVRIDYLMNEAKIKVLNTLSPYKKELSIIESRINMCLDQEDYQDVIDLVAEYNDLADYNDPHLVCLSCYCAYKIGDYEYALNFYNEIGEEFLRPEDYYNMMQCALELYDFEKAIEYGKKYNEYEPEANVKVYYMLSIAYAHLGNFAYAISSIETARELNSLFYGIDNTYINEETILRALQNGKKVEMYSEENYNNFEITDDEREYETDLFDLDYCFSLDVVKKSLKKFKTHNEKIMYMLTIIKILIRNDYDKNRDIKKMCDYLESYIGTADVSDSEKEKYTFALKNYKKI